MTRCQVCWNVSTCCTCPMDEPPAGVCVPHSTWEPRNPRYFRRSARACTCGRVPLFGCECCHKYKVVTKCRGIGYWCDDCLPHAFADTAEEVEADHRRAQFRVVSSPS